MYIEFVKNDDGTHIPHVQGRLCFPLVQFLIHLRVTPMKQGGRREPTTINNMATHMKIWFDYCADLGLKFDQVTYGLNLEMLKKSLKAERAQAQSINAYYRTWRAFYEWCDSQGFGHLMQFPAKIESNKNQLGGNPLLANQLTRNVKALTDPGLEAVTTVDDYKELVLNHDDFTRFAEELRAVDPVYEMIGYMMVTTGLRIGGVMQIPVGADKRNPKWLRYPELAASGATLQKLTYSPKGNKRLLQCIVLTESLKVLHENYVKSLRKERAEIYKSKFKTIDIPLWLNQNGKQIQKNDIWNAFRTASLALGRQVKPHHLRHTYATYIIYNYFKAHGLKPNLAYAHDIHEQLRSQLGHRDIEVTKMYIRTVIRTETEAWLPVLTPHVKHRVEGRMADHVLASMAKFFEPTSSLDTF